MKLENETNGLRRKNDEKNTLAISEINVHLEYIREHIDRTERRLRGHDEELADLPIRGVRQLLPITERVVALEKARQATLAQLALIATGIAGLVQGVAYFFR
jgi:hypothetical protein